jgi:uncharacterized protein YcbX
MKVVGLNCYPIKSCHRIELQHADLTERGIQYDRMFMVVV